MLPEHIEATIGSIRRIYAEHHEQATPQQRVMTRVTAMIGRPMFLAFLGAVVVSWIGLNLIMKAEGYPAFDPPPFSWLQGAMTLLSLSMIVFVLSAQRHDDELAEKRDTLTLELALLSDQKTAKMIQLLEEFRRDSPQVSDRRDKEAEVMARPADPHSVLDAMKETGPPEQEAAADSPHS
jgi:uncharacterized membrane protein